MKPSLDANQYVHTAWRIDDGTLKRLVHAIAQTADGYLWLGTDSGIIRFDGAHFVEWNPPDGQRLPGQMIHSLLTAHDGTLWIATSHGLATWHGNRLRTLPELNGQRVVALAEDHGGTVWLSSSSGGSASSRICSIRAGAMRCYGQDGSLGRVGYLHEHGGYLWASATTGLWRWNPGPPKRYAVNAEARSLASDSAGRLVIATEKGIQQLARDRVEPYEGMTAGREANAIGVLRDRDGSFWAGTMDRGLLHLHQGRTDLFARADGLSGDFVYQLFEDREGSIWISTYDGLDRLRDVSVAAMSAKQGLPGVLLSVLAAREGRLWFATSAGLMQWNNGQLTPYGKAQGLTHRVESLYEDERGQIWAASRSGLSRFAQGRFVPVDGVPGGYTWQAAGAAGNVWTSSVDQGLSHVRDGKYIETVPWTRLGTTDFASAMLEDPSTGVLWLGLFKGGLLAYKDGRVRASYGDADGLGRGRISHLRLDGNGALWAATAGGLSRIKDRRIATLNSRNGLPCDSVHWSMEDDGHALWLYTACGLVQVARTDIDAWIGNPKQTVATRLFDASDGVRLYSTPPSGYSPPVAKTSDGRLWFNSGSGVGIVDPQRLPFNSIPPPVHIEQVIADRIPVAGGRLPALTRDVEIDYTALSLVAPEKVRFKYRLEGHDRDWVDAGNRRQAFYTNLPPRNYRFRVIAANNSGVWNETGDTLEFSIAPAYYQTTWFRVLCGAAFLALLAAGYRLRMLQVQRESRQLRDVIETIPAFVWSAAPDGSVDFINRRFLQFSGFTAPQALGWGWANALHPDDRGPLVEGWLAAVASGTPMEAEARMRSTTGEYRWLMFRAVPLQDAAGKILKWYGKTTDIEEQKRAEQARARLHELEAEMAHINRVSMMGELAASVAHEVNQPLTGIVSNGSACLRLLAGDSPNVEEAREAIGDIVRDGKRAGEVIARIRAMTKRAALPRERVDLREVIREVLVLVGDEAKKRHVVVRTQFAEGVSPVFGDRVQLQQVVLNLVMNAMEAMSGVTGRQRELVIHTRNVEDGQVAVTVEDSGIGLDPTSMSKIFNPFYTTKASGMGMGLSICRSIVQNHGGRLWATANEGAGTSFHFTVPAHSAEGKDAGSAVV